MKLKIPSDQTHKQTKPEEEHLPGAETVDQGGL